MKKIVFIFLTFFQIIACSPINEDESMCDDKVIIDKNLFDSAPNSSLNIKKIEIFGDCLSIDFNAGGCSGNTWKVKLIDSENILYSNPLQRNLRLSLENNELCDKIVYKTVLFDISKLQFSGSEVILNITNSNQKITYKY